MQVYQQALTLYFSGKGNPAGCFYPGTAVTESGTTRWCASSWQWVSNSWTRRSNAASGGARTKGDFRRTPDPDTLAGLASAVHATLGVRASPPVLHARDWKNRAQVPSRRFAAIHEAPFHVATPSCNVASPATRRRGMKMTLSRTEVNVRGLPRRICRTFTICA